MIPPLRCRRLEGKKGSSEFSRAQRGDKQEDASRLGIFSNPSLRQYEHAVSDDAIGAELEAEEGGIEREKSRRESAFVFRFFPERSPL